MKSVEWENPVSFITLMKKAVINYLSCFFFFFNRLKCDCMVIGCYQYPKISLWRRLFVLITNAIRNDSYYYN